MFALPYLVHGLLLAYASPLRSWPSSLRIASYNLRYDAQPDNITVQQSLAALDATSPLREPSYGKITQEQPWSTRRLLVAEHLLSQNVLIASFQEALVRQVRDLAELFGDGWSWLGVGRDDGAEAGEFGPIFYRTARVRLLSHDSFWLSNTPFEPSKFWAAGSVRICTVAHFELVLPGPGRGGTRFTLLNTHLDDQSDAQRRLGASLILARARYEAVKTRGPVFVTGDFNSPSKGWDSGAYRIITGAAPPVRINATFAAKFAVDRNQLPDFHMLDLRDEAPRRSVSAVFATFTGFSRPGDTSQWARIDFIFGGSNSGWSAQAYRVDPVRSDDGTLASDHRPTYADVLI